MLANSVSCSLRYLDRSKSSCHEYANPEVGLIAELSTLLETDRRFVNGTPVKPSANRLAQPEFMSYLLNFTFFCPRRAPAHQPIIRSSYNTLEISGSKAHERSSFPRLWHSYAAQPSQRNARLLTLELASGTCC